MNNGSPLRHTDTLQKTLSSFVFAKIVVQAPQNFEKGYRRSLLQTTCTGAHDTARKLTIIAVHPSSASMSLPALSDVSAGLDRSQ